MIMLPNPTSERLSLMLLLIVSILEVLGAGELREKLSRTMKAD